ncbi:MAG: hypothetical protein RL701_8021 [Pseudomonadota bacterium]
MLAFASISFSMAAIAFLSLRRFRLAAVVTQGLAVAACIQNWGSLEGLLVQLTLSMTLASALVLLLPPHKTWTRPLAVTHTMLGTALGVWSLCS